MRINLRIFILSSIVFILLVLLVIRSCHRPPKKGELVYEQKCASCHGHNGEGFRNLIPPINDSAYLMQNANDLSCIIAYGLNKKIVVNGTEYDQPMQGIEDLNETEIANVINYIFERWGDPSHKITPQEVEIRMANCE